MDERSPDSVAKLGAYGYPVAARLLNVSTSQVRSWSKGYTRRVRFAQDRTYAPVLQTDHEDGYVTFLELIELIYCREFMKENVPLKNIRKAAENLSREVGQYPFATKRLLVNGRSLIADLGGDLGLDAVTRQVVFDVGAAIRPNVLYNSAGQVDRLYVASGNAVFLDPGVRFGEPVLTSRPVPTRSIFNLYNAEEENVETVAHYFGITEREVTTAVEFEREPTMFAA